MATNTKQLRKMEALLREVGSVRDFMDILYEATQLVGVLEEFEDVLEREGFCQLGRNGS